MTELAGSVCPVVTSQFPHSMPLADLDKTQTTVTEAEAEAAASAQTKSKSQRRRRSKREPVREKTTATQREDVFVHIDMPPPNVKAVLQAPRKSSSDTGLHRAKIVAMPIASDVSDSQGSDTPISRSPFFADLDHRSARDAASQRKQAKGGEDCEGSSISSRMSHEHRHCERSSMCSKMSHEHRQCEGSSMCSRMCHEHRHDY
ncbi:hypothetical protein TELCIR_02578 [Teladorsagia circumcincta]|uniref:Uncharacterized protein n=1 Tax=Teladorsagia circumcincta TaxID=45464 RepID=A0A2G9UZ19_TELCI|nr:hypothetical protein TELCIR_02578 [Teladorsagia circumcincta]